MTSGLLVIDKPAGITSFAVVAAVRKNTAIKKVGHAGTLDPMATGILVVALGRATRLIRYVQESDKEYRATIQFGIATDSLDADGVETERVPMSFDREALEEALETFRGQVSQIPPMVSALKVGGERLYDLARAGKEVEREARQVLVSVLEVVDFEPRAGFPIATVRVVASKGTYVRTLADDIARTLGGRAHLTALRRLRIGRFGVAEAISLEALSDWQEHLRLPAEAVSDLAPWLIDSAEAAAVRSGRSLPAAIGEGPWAMLAEADNLLGVYRRDADRAVAEVVLA
ncbi:tRNA pseudouridine(55) synthase TruB [soil metagenome]